MEKIRCGRFRCRWIWDYWERWLHGVSLETLVLRHGLGCLSWCMTRFGWAGYQVERSEPDMVLRLDEVETMLVGAVARIAVDIEEVSIVKDVAAAS
jgi:hypothetical protein